MVIHSLCQHDTLRLMRPCLSFLRQWAHVHCAPPWAQPCGRLAPCKSAVLPICPSTVATAMLSVAGTHWRKKSGAIIAPPGEKSGLVCRSLMFENNPVPHHKSDTQHRIYIIQRVARHGDDICDLAGLQRPGLFPYTCGYGRIDGTRHQRLHV